MTRLFTKGSGSCCSLRKINITINTSSDITRLVRIKQPFAEVVQLIPRIMGLLIPYHNNAFEINRFRSNKNIINKLKSHSKIRQITNIFKGAVK